MTSEEHRDDDLQALHALGSIEPSEAVAERVRELGRAELHAATDGSAWVSMAVRAWNRVGLPAALAVTVVGYLSWAVTSASALYR